MTSAPAIYKDIVITGWGLPEAPGKGPSGDVRAFDVRTGRPAWTFHTVPRPGEAGNDTWEEDSWKERMGANVWSTMSVDEERVVVAQTVSSFGLHADYHKASDEVAKIDFTHMTRSIGSLVRPVRWLVSSRFRPAWLPGKQP